MAKKSLNEKQLLFCKQYVRCKFNATKAYMAAYPDSEAEAARRSAADLLTKPDIKEEISRLKEIHAKKLGITSERVVAEIANVAFSHIGLVADFDNDGKVVLKDKKEMGKHIRSIHSLHQDEIFDRDGNLLRVKNKFNLHDKLKALELLGKHLGILDGDNADRKNKDVSKRRLSEAMERAEERLAKRRAK